MRLPVAALTALLTVLLLAPVPLAPALPAADALVSPAAPAAADDSSLDLVSLTPTSLDENGTLEAVVEVTNTSSTPMREPALELRTRTSRVTERDALRSWQGDTDPDTQGAPIASSAPQGVIAPGKSARLSVRASARSLGYSTEPYYWGARRLSLTLTTADGPVEALRTFVVWRPRGADQVISQSVLLPVADPEPGVTSLDAQAAAASASSGYLGDLRSAALDPRLDWWLDPSLVDPPAISTHSDENPPPTPSAAPSSDTVPDYAPAPAMQELADALRGGVGDRTVLARPYLDADTVALADPQFAELRTAVADAGDRAWKASGITPRASALSIPGPAASAQAVQAAQGAAPDAVILPPASVGSTTDTFATRSSVGRLSGPGGATALLAPDPGLSTAFAALSTDSDPEQVRQLLLADTATIAGQDVEAPRHLLIAPSLGPNLNPDAMSTTMDAFDQAPWIRSARTADLLDAADGPFAQTTSDTSRGLYAVGEVNAEDVTPTQPSADGEAERLRRPVPQPHPQHSLLRDAASAQSRATALAEAMEDDAVLDAPSVHTLAALSQRYTDDPDRAATMLREAQQELDRMLSMVTVEPASGYNLVSDSSGVPITLNNGLDTAITVRPRLRTDRPLVRISEPKQVTIPARGQAEVTVPVEAVANGMVTLEVEVTTPSGRHLNGPVSAPLTVNPAWENWTTMVLVVLMTALVIVGVLRARRTGSRARAPGVLTPEDPVELARTGRSLPVSSLDAGSAAPSAPPAPPPTGDEPSGDHSDTAPATRSARARPDEETE